MKTVAQLIEWYQKQKSDHYDTIVILDSLRGPYASLTYFDVHDVIKTEKMLSFYGRNAPRDPIRYVRINRGKIIRSEA